MLIGVEITNLDNIIALFDIVTRYIYTQHIFKYVNNFRSYVLAMISIEVGITRLINTSIRNMYSQNFSTITIIH